MKSIFFATSFSGHVDYDTGVVHDDFRERLEVLLATIRDAGFGVYCAIEAEGWRITSEAPGTGMARNFSEIEKKDIFLALVDKAGSDGRGVEIEYAYNAGKQVVLATGPAETLGWVIQELVALDRARHVTYDQPTDLVQEIAKI